MHRRLAPPTPPLAVVALWAPDVERAAHFHREVVGLPLMPHHGSQPHFDLGGVLLTIVEGIPHSAEGANSARFPVLAFRVASLEAAVARLQAAGVPMPGGIEANVGSRWVMFHDPAGNLVEIVAEI